MSPHASPLLERIAPRDAGVLRQLFELYCHDFSELVPLPLQPSGRFDVPLGDEWWTRDDHFPFFIRRDRELCGFALVRCGSRLSDTPEVMDVAEFFIVRGARRGGLGGGAARELFRRFPGPWEIRVRQGHAAAQAFWTHVTTSWLGARLEPQPYQRGDVAWQVLRLRT